MLLSQLFNIKVLGKEEAGAEARQVTGDRYPEKRNVLRRRALEGLWVPYPAIW